MSKTYLIIDYGHYGDHLYTTTIARQIKNDFPDSHITWAIKSKYKSILDLNPHVDKVWEISNDKEWDALWTAIKPAMQSKKSWGEYNFLISQETEGDWANFDGTLRSSFLRRYDKPITVPVNPVIRLMPDEIKRVKEFSQKHNLHSYKQVILFECSSNSNQSFVNVPVALKIAETIIKQFNDVCFIFSSPEQINHPDIRIIDGSELTFRENAELTKYCTLLVGCSSGITWLSTSDWAKNINKLQLIKRYDGPFCGLKYDFEYWGLPTSNVIEITSNDLDHSINCLKCILEDDFSIAKRHFDETYRPSYRHFRAHARLIVRYSELNKFLMIKKIIGLQVKRNPHLNRIILAGISLLEASKFCIVTVYAFIRRILIINQCGRSTINNI